MKRALLLIDFQHDFLARNGRLRVAQKQVAGLIDSANLAILQARTRGDIIVAVGNEFRSADYVGNIFRKFAAIEGTKGAAWDERVPLDAIPYFPKRASDAFSNPQLERFLISRGAKELILSGVFASACITATARGARSRGFAVSVLKRAVGDGTDARRDAALSRLSGIGVQILSSLYERNNPNTDC